MTSTPALAVGPTFVTSTVVVSVSHTAWGSHTCRVTGGLAGPSSAVKVAVAPATLVDAVAVQIPGVGQRVAGIGIGAACTVERHAAALGDDVGAASLSDRRPVIELEGADVALSVVRGLPALILAAHRRRGAGRVVAGVDSGRTDSRAKVCVGPPFSASTPSCGSPVLKLTPLFEQEPSSTRLLRLVSMAPPVV